MKQVKHTFSFDQFDSIEELPAEDQKIFEKAKAVATTAYAPYSEFRVGAVARLSSGEIVTGTNQENASYPLGLCAERVLLATVGSLFPNAIIADIAITYNPINGESNHPVTPCGICRQSLQEYEQRVNHPIRLILGGLTGKIFVIPRASFLLPLAFNGSDLATPTTARNSG